MAGFMSKICAKSAIVPSSTGGALTGKQAVNDHVLEAAKKFNEELERKLAVSNVLHARNLAMLEKLKNSEARQSGYSAAVHSGTTSESLSMMPVVDNSIHRSP